MGSTTLKYPSYHGNHPIPQLAQICATVNMGFLKVEISSFDKMYVDKCGTSMRPYSLNKPLLGPWLQHYKCDMVFMFRLG